MVGCNTDFTKYFLATATLIYGFISIKICMYNNVGRDLLGTSSVKTTNIFVVVFLIKREAYLPPFAIENFIKRT